MWAIREVESETSAVQSARQALSDAIASALANVAALLREGGRGDAGNHAQDEAVQLLQQVEGALAFVQQPVLAELARLMQSQLHSGGDMEPARSARLAAAALVLQRTLVQALDCARHRREPRAAWLLPCWHEIAALGAAVESSPAVLLSLQLPDDALLSALPSADPHVDQFVDDFVNDFVGHSANQFANHLADAERALLACLRADGATLPGEAARAFGTAVVVAIEQSRADSERACWLAVQACLQELMAADGGRRSAADKRMLATTLRALRHRGSAGLRAVLEPLAREALLSLSERPLRTKAGKDAAQLFRLDEQLGVRPAATDDSPQGEAALAAFTAALAHHIAALERDPAQIPHASLWQSLAEAAALAPCTSALAEPLARLAARLPQMHDERQCELLAALLLELHAWSAQGGGGAAALAAVVELAGAAEPAVAGLALHAHAQAGSVRRRLTELCDAIRAELCIAEPALEAAWQGGDWTHAAQSATVALSRVAGALAVAGLHAGFDAANAMCDTLSACRDDDARAVLPALAAEWVSLAAEVAMLPFRAEAGRRDAAPAEGMQAVDGDEAGQRLRTIFIDEAAGHLHNLRQLALACDAHEVPAARRAAHTLAGCSATVGQPAMASLALALEGHLLAGGWQAGSALLADTLDTLDRMLAEVSAQGQCKAQTELLVRLRAEPTHRQRAEGDGGQDAGGLQMAPDEPDDAGNDASGPDGGPIDACEHVTLPDSASALAGAGGGRSPAAITLPLASGADTCVPAASAMIAPPCVQPIDELSAQELLATFSEEAADLLPQLELALHAWQQQPDDGEPPRQMLRLLHTLKGSARMAGRQALGEAFHQAESEIAALAQQSADKVLLALPCWHACIDGWMQASLCAVPLDRPDRQAGSSDDLLPVAGVAVPADAAAAALRQHESPAPPARQHGASTAKSTAAAPQLRVSAARLARVADAGASLWVGNAGIADAVQDQRLAVASLSDDLARLRAQLRELEIEAESRIVAQATSAGDAGFDPLEFDRYTRLHELTRLMVESLADLAGTQRGMARQLERLGAAASAQASDLRRFGLDLQAIRSQPLRAIESRLRHLLRQAAQEAGREAVLALDGGDVEVERSVLDRLVEPLGHLLRNAAVHGIEAADQRVLQGKPRTGTVTLGAALAGSELRLWLQDDGRGVDLEQVRRRAVAAGLLGAGDDPDDAALAALIFAPGFSTASEVTPLAGRGIGMDAVRAELQALGGRISVDSVAGQGCCFTLTVPVALASLPALLANAGARRIALPAAQIEQVVQPRPGQVETDADGRWIVWRDGRLPLRHLGEALGERSTLAAGDRDRLPVVIIGDGERRLALQLDDVLGQRELMLRHPGPQLARVPGITGATLLGDGRIALIVDPFRLPDLPSAVAVTEPERPLVLVVDDSLTVRRASQRLLERHGYAVALARDGFEALERLAERRPDALLLDIEMPRMDGFELLAALRADTGLYGLPVVMITSRIAGRHRERAQQLGVLGYLGKPFDEEALLALLASLQGGARLAA